MKISELENIILKNSSKTSIARGKTLIEDKSFSIDIHKVGDFYNIYGSLNNDKNTEVSSPVTTSIKTTTTVVATTTTEPTTVITTTKKITTTTEKITEPPATEYIEVTVRLLPEGYSYPYGITLSADKLTLTPPFDEEEVISAVVTDIDGKKIEGSQQEAQLHGGNAVAGSAQGRHQGRGDGHPGDHVALLLPGVADAAGQTAEQGDQHIPYGGGGAGDHFAGGRRQRRQGKVDGGSDQTDDHLGAEASGGPAQHGQIADSQGVAHGEDPAHQRRHQHGADDYRRGVHIQTDGGNKDGHDQNPHIGAVDMGVFLHHLVQGLIAHHVAPQVKQIVKIFLRAAAPPGGGLLFCSVHSAALRKYRAAARRRQRQFL